MLTGYTPVNCYDIYYTDEQADSIHENSNQGIDTQIRSYDSNYLLAANVENITLTGSVFRGNGNELDNVILGNDVDNNLWGGGGDDTLKGNGGNDVIIGSDGNDHLEGNAGNDLLDGGSGNDTILGGAGNDQLDGGAGTNILRGGTGDDRYVYSAGAGVYEIDNSDGGTDWLRFTDDISMDRLSFIKSGDNLVVRVDDDESHQVTVTNWFLGEEYQIDYIQPADVSGIAASKINRMFPPDNPEADEIVVPAELVFDAKWYGTNAGEQLAGTAGKDIIRGYQGDDNIAGFDGDDWLLGGSGNDSLTGGTGDDTLYGGAGDDRYIFMAGSGRDVIDTSGGGTDWLLFGEGLTMDKLEFTRLNDDLVINIINTEDSVTVRNWFLGSEYQLAYIQPGGVYAIPASQIAGLLSGSGEFDTVVNGTSAGEQLVGTSGTNQLNGAGGNDQLFGLAGNDELNGGTGNDYLDGGAGDDIQNGGEGNDQLGGDAGNDALRGGAGDDTYVYRAGAGADIIDNQGGGTDRLIFNDKITSDRLSYHQEGDNLIVRVDGSESTQVTVTGWFLGADYQLSYIHPSGGSGIPASRINDMFVTTPPPPGDPEIPAESTFDTVREGTAGNERVVGTNGNDLLKAFAGDDQLFGFGGNDWLVAGDGNDYLDGGAGDDVQLGGDGNDQLGGDAGNDILRGGAGNDTYVYKAGAGADIIDNQGGGTDWLIFTNDITADRLTYHQSDDNLLIKIDGSDSSMVTVRDWFKGSEYQVAYIQPAGSHGIPASQIDGLLEPAPSISPATAEGFAAAGDPLASLASNPDTGGTDGDYSQYKTSSGAPLSQLEDDALGVGSDLENLVSEQDRKTNNLLLAA